MLTALVLTSDGNYQRENLSVALFYQRMSIDRIELCGAVLNKRLKTVLQQQCSYKFQRYYHIVDSQIVHARIHKETYGFNTFAATRVGGTGLKVKITLLIG